jgi:aspartate/methionine/tyrosine aminotransferase
MLTITCANLLGWRIGWACAVANIAAAIRNIHVKLTDSAPAPFQEAALIALSSTPDYYESLKTVRFAVNRL